MKVKQLVIKNIGVIEDMAIPLNQELTVFYGDIKQGKTTILNSVRWVLGDSFPDDIIRHGQQEAHIQLDALNDALQTVVVRREWYVGKDGTTKARQIQYTINGVLQAKPAEKLAEFLNPFMLNQDFFNSMSETDKSRYLVKLFAVDTSAEDLAIAAASSKAQQLRATVKGYGAIDLTPVGPVDVAGLRQQLQDRRLAREAALTQARQGKEAAVKAHSEANTEYLRVLSDVRAHNERVSTSEKFQRGDAKQVLELEATLKTLRDAMAVRNTWLADNPMQKEPSEPAHPDTSAFDAILAPVRDPDTEALELSIQKAAADEVRREQYLKNVERAKLRDADNLEILRLEQEQRDLKEAKVAKLKDIQTGIPELVFLEDGTFTFEGSTPGMLSTSQSMKLSGLLSDRYPDGLGMALLDKGESLGKSLFTLVDRAKTEDKAILVTVVGEKPARIPEDVGVFVVENGKLQ